MLAAAFAAVEQTKASFIVSISRGLIGIVALVLIFSRIWGMTGVWLSFPATEAVTLLTALILYRRSREGAKA